MLEPRSVIQNVKRLVAARGGNSEDVHLSRDGNVIVLNIARHERVLLRHDELFDDGWLDIINERFRALLPLAHEVKI